jgi:hypothetical protein
VTHSPQRRPVNGGDRRDSASERATASRHPQHPQLNPHQLTIDIDWIDKENSVFAFLAN